MKKNKFPDWLPVVLIIGAIFFILVAGKFLVAILPFLIFGVVAYQIYKTIQEQKGKNIPDVSDILEKELGKLFQKAKKSIKKDKHVVDVEEKKTSSASKKIKNKPNFSFSFPPMNGANVKLGGVVAAIAIIALIILDGLVSVPPGHVAVIFDRGRGILDDPLGEGLHLKIPFWQESERFTTRIQHFTMAGEYIGEKDANAVNGRSKDGQDIFADVTITYSVNPTDAPYLRRNFLTENGYRNTVIFPNARSVIYDALGQYNAMEVISTKRDKLQTDIKERLEEKFAPNKIQLQDVLIRKVSFSPEFAKAVEEKQIEKENAEKEKNKLERTKIEAEKVIEAAKGEAEAIRLKGEALRENPEIIQLEFVEKMAPQINWGILPNDAVPLIDLKQMQNK